MTTIHSPHSSRRSRWAEYGSELWRRREFAFFLALGNLRARNASTSLGLLWWVLNPLLLAMVYFFVFGLLLGSTRGEETAFLAWLLSGMFAFNYTTSSMMGGSNSVLQNERLLVNMRFPRMILPISALVETAAGFLASMAVYYLIVIPGDGIYPTRWLAMLPAVFVLQTMFNLGISTIAARLVIPFRDITNVLPHLLRFWLYLSPVIWTLDLLERAPGWVEAGMRANPMFAFLSLYRTALMGKELDPTNLWASIAWAVVICIGGVVSFVRFEGKMVRYL